MKDNNIKFNFDNTYIKLPEVFFEKQVEKNFENPKLVLLNNQLANELGLDKEALEEQGAKVFSGNEFIKGSEPIAQAYVGHQFGNLNMLGDGRAMLLGEHLINGERFDIQLKGAGRTTYSRGGDGKAALMPMLREYIISEAMYNLNIETTRSLAVVETGELIYREKREKGAVLTRIATSHLRVGTFQYARHLCNEEELKSLADYTIERHFKEYENKENKYLWLLKEVIKKQAKLIAKWQLVGFIHGVMNTDNMAINGETIDYGPCAFMDTYNKDTVFSSIDMYGRYSYQNQPNMAGWNLARFAESIMPLLSEEREKSLKIAQEAIEEFPKIYKNHWLLGMNKKIGLSNSEDLDEELIENLLDIMEKEELDYTNTFYNLTIRNTVNMSKEFRTWEKSWIERVNRQEISFDKAIEIMKESNPVVIPRNYRVEEALEKANEGDYTEFNNLLEAVKEPYNYDKNINKKYIKTPEKREVQYVTYCGT